MADELNALSGLDPEALSILDQIAPIPAAPTPVEQKSQGQKVLEAILTVGPTAIAATEGGSVLGEVAGFQAEQLARQAAEEKRLAQAQQIQAQKGREEALEFRRDIAGDFISRELSAQDVERELTGKKELEAFKSTLRKAETAVGKPISAGERIQAQTVEEALGITSGTIKTSEGLKAASKALEIQDELGGRSLPRGLEGSTGQIRLPKGPEGKTIRERVESMDVVLKELDAMRAVLEDYEGPASARFAALTAQDRAQLKASYNTIVNARKFIENFGAALTETEIGFITDDLPQLLDVASTSKVVGDIVSRVDPLAQISILGKTVADKELGKLLKRDIFSPNYAYDNKTLEQNLVPHFRTNPQTGQREMAPIPGMNRKQMLNLAQKSKLIAIDGLIQRKS